jgi:hypothetical protein
VSKRASSWRPRQSRAEERLEDIAGDHVTVLHRTIREDPSAFGLYEAACAAGERLTEHAWIREPLPDGADFATALTEAVGGTGGTVAEAAVRRAAARSAKRLMEQYPDAMPDGNGRGLSGDLFCLLFQWLFADVVGEFLRAVVAEKITLAAPVLAIPDPEGRLADWAAKEIVGVLPDPCEEAARQEEAGAMEATADAVDGESAVAGAEATIAVPLIARVARELVPRAVGRALGLIGDGEDSEDAGGSPYEGGSAA